MTKNECVPIVQKKEILRKLSINYSAEEEPRKSILHRSYEMTDTHNGAAKLCSGNWEKVTEGKSSSARLVESTQEGEKIFLDGQNPSAEKIST